MGLYTKAHDYLCVLGELHGTHLDACELHLISPWGPYADQAKPEVGDAVEAGRSVLVDR